MYPSPLRIGWNPIIYRATAPVLSRFRVIFSRLHGQIDDGVRAGIGGKDQPRLSEFRGT